MKFRIRYYGRKNDGVYERTYEGKEDRTDSSGISPDGL
jgi:hypothetical protein